MFPRWFGKWVEDNPKDIFGPAILIGALGGAIFFAVMLITWGQPYATASVQTGPRGTGMSVTKFKSEMATPDPTIQDYLDLNEAPYEVEPDTPLAKDIYENVQVLGDVDEENFNRIMLAMTNWVSPEQGCAYCHGEEGNFASDDLYTKVVSRRMIQMTQNINENWGEHVQEVGVNCYTCHRGQNVPSEIWFDPMPANEVMEGWGAVQNRVTAVSQSTSLPSDALQKLLVDGELIAVHDLEPRVDNEGTATWQDTERTYSLMNYFSNSLNVNCNFCHNSRAFYDFDQVTPQWATAQIGIGMVQEMNDEYLIPLGPTYPEHRLGPINGDAPKAACATCHKGYNKPLQGTPMLVDWPELATVSGE